MNQEQLIKELSEVKHEGLFADCIRLDPKGALPMIIDQIKDSRVVVVSIIGENLVSIIEKIES